MPEPVAAVVVLALLTRVRAARIAAGEISASRLYDVRAFKCALAELGYLRTLTRRATGGTIVTAMTQLVSGLARLHPAWTMTGDKFVDRDRHQQAVRRHLRDLDAMGLLLWRIGVDVDGEDARTELELRAAPELTDEELAAAAAQLARWKARYGAALNTGSSTGIRNAARHGRPLAASERQRRGMAHTRARARSRREVSMTNSAPHFVAPPLAENSPESRSNATELRNVCGPRTGARMPVNLVTDDDSCVSRSNTLQTPSVAAAVSAEVATTALRMGGSNPPEGAPELLSQSALVERVAARLTERRPVWDLIATQARARALETACWSLDRAWPLGRLREAWVVWRHGAQCAAELGPVAGWLERDDPDRLRRAATRYERYVDGRAAGFPVQGLAALAHIAAVAARDDLRPLTLHYGIRALDQLSRGMRAAATAHDAARLEHAIARARRRHNGDVGGDLPFTFRRSRSWPSWVTLDAAGNPLLEDGHLVIRDALGITGAPVDRDDPAYLEQLRDAHLLRGLWPPLHADGRTQMAESRTHYDPAADQRRADPAPYAPPDHRRACVDPADLRLARLSHMPLREVQRLDVSLRDQLLAERDAEDRADRLAERDALWQRITASCQSPEERTC